MILWPAPEKLQAKGASRKITTTLSDRAGLTAAILASQQGQRGEQCIVLTGETCHYRTAARSVPIDDESWLKKTTDPLKALEIGSAHGDTLNILSRRLGGACNVWGVDKSYECIQRTNERFPHLTGRSVLLDCFSEDHFEALAELVKDVDICCVDIGGNRHAEALLLLLRRSLWKVPLIIVKARLLYERAVEFELERNEDGISKKGGDCNDDLSSWWNNIKQKTATEEGGAGLGIPPWAIKAKKKNKIRIQSAEGGNAAKIDTD